MGEGCRYLCFVPRLPSEEARAPRLHASNGPELSMLNPTRLAGHQ